jgi:hypothetical protein
MAAHQWQFSYLYRTAVQLTSQSLSGPHLYSARIYTALNNQSDSAPLR